MKNVITKIVLCAWALFLSSGVTFAQEPERIDFPKYGPYVDHLSQIVKAKGTKAYVVFAKKGQKLALGFYDSTEIATVVLGKETIFGPSAPNVRSFSTTIEVTKDYIFTLSNNSDKEAYFSFILQLIDPKRTPPAKKPAPIKETVRFAKGATSTKLTRTIAAWGSIDFNFAAKKGQEMEYEVKYDYYLADVDVALTGPGIYGNSALGPNTIALHDVSNTGNHCLTVNNTSDKKITITLHLSIKK